MGRMIAMCREPPPQPPTPTPNAKHHALAPNPYPATMFTSRPGTTMIFFTALPARAF